MLTCQQLTELVTDYLEGNLSLMERVRFELHLGMCRHCRAYLRQVRMLVRVMGRLPDEPMPERTRDELLARFRGMKARGGGGKLPAGWAVRVLAALEKALGSRRRGWWAVPLVMLGLAVVAWLSAGENGPLGGSRPCLPAELGAGMLPLVALGLAARTNGTRLSPATYTAVSTAGALGAYGVLQFTCPLAHVAPHVLTFHVGGVLVAAAIGAAVSRLPALR